MSGRLLLTKLDMALALSMIAHLKIALAQDQVVDVVLTVHLSATLEESTL